MYIRVPVYRGQIWSQKVCLGQRFKRRVPKCRACAWRLMSTMAVLFSSYFKHQSAAPPTSFSPSPLSHTPPTQPAAICAHQNTKTPLKTPKNPPQMPKKYMKPLKHDIKHLPNHAEVHYKVTILTIRCNVGLHTFPVCPCPGPVPDPFPYLFVYVGKESRSTPCWRRPVG